MKDRISKLPLLSQDLLKLEKCQSQKRFQDFLAVTGYSSGLAFQKPVPFRGLYDYLCMLPTRIVKPF